MTGVMCAVVGGGKRTFSGSATMNVGYYNLDITIEGTRYLGYYTGYISGLMGSMSNYDFGGGAVINQFDYYNFTVYPVSGPSFPVIGINLTVLEDIGNQGWSTISAGSSTLNRADAGYSGGGGQSAWTWSGTNIFGTSGTKAIVWG